MQLIVILSIGSMSCAMIGLVLMVIFLLCDHFFSSDFDVIETGVVWFMLAAGILLVAAALALGITVRWT